MLDLMPRKKVYPKTKLVLHMHIGLGLKAFFTLEYISRIWPKVRIFFNTLA